MQYLPWWAAGLALSAVVLVHWFATSRMMAVSGRFTRLVDRIRFGPEPEQPEMSEEELRAAIAAITAEEFGAEAVQSAEVPSDEAPGPGESLPIRTPQPPWVHVVFLLALILGGVISTLAFGELSLSWGLSSTSFAALTGSRPVTGALVLLGGGMLVGFGTRMSGGCTSGHGLCGVSRFQPGSLLATAAFFGAGIITSFALGLAL